MYRPGKDVWAFGVEPAKVRYRLRLARYPALAETLREWLTDKDPATTFKLLDIGAGFGRTFLYVQHEGVGDRFEMVGLDIDPARKDDVYAGNPWNIQTGDAEDDLPFADHSLDIVICEQLLEHLNHPDTVIKNVHRALKPGGIFIVGVPIFPEPIAKLRRWRVKRFGLGKSEHIQTYSLRSIKRDLAELYDVQESRGFRVISGGLLRPLENYEWWYRFNRRLGALVPGFCIEVQLIVTPKKQDNTSR